MLKIFGGMIIGSLMTMMLLGGASAADKVLVNAQTLYLDQLNRPDAMTTVLLLVVISIFMGTLSMWPTRPAKETQQFIKKLHRHCK